MLAIRLTLLFAAVNIVSPAAGPLRVIRVTPESPADPLAEITVTFDRPVAGGLDSTVRPGDIFRISPRTDGRLEWRDPLTIRFLPDRPLTPETLTHLQKVESVALFVAVAQAVNPHFQLTVANGATVAAIFPSVANRSRFSNSS